MSRLPNPFLQDSGQGQQQQRNPGSPGFLLMTRPPTGSNSYGGRRGNNRQSYPHHSTPGDPSSNFISFSPMCSKNGSFDNSLKRSGGGRGRYGRGGGGDVSGCGRPYGFQGTPRFSHPYQHSPSRNNQSFTNTPRSRFGQNQGADKFGSAGGGRYNNGKAWRGRGDRGPISDIPIDKFISPSMVKDPWAEFDVFEDEKNSTEAPGSGSSPVVASLDDSEIIIDSDASVIVESTYDDGASGVEADSPAMPDTGSESPYVATSSTSEKDTGSDTASDG